jgi:hypothetical protein
VLLGFLVFEIIKLFAKIVDGTAMLAGEILDGFSVLAVEVLDLAI